MGKRAGIELDDFDALFGGDTSALESKLVSASTNKADYPVMDINIELIDEFPEHPFKVIDDEEMDKLAANIAEYGVLHSGIIREAGNGRYQMISGHRRLYASRKAGKVTMPVRIMNLSDDEATILMADANFLQRVEIMPSEKAKAYKKKYDAIKSQGKKGTGNSLKTLGEAAGESDKTVQRFIRLSYLSDALLELVDVNKLGVKQGVEISYLSDEYQGYVLDAIEQTGVNMSIDQAMKIKEYGTNGKLIPEMVILILTEKKPSVRKFSLKAEKLNQYFTDEYSNEEIERIILQLLEKWKGGESDG